MSEGGRGAGRRVPPAAPLGPWGIVAAFAAAQLGGSLLIALVLGALAAHAASSSTLTQWAVRLTYGLSSTALLLAALGAVRLLGPDRRAVPSLWTWPGWPAVLIGVAGGLLLKLAGNLLAAAQAALFGQPATNNPLVLFPHAFAQPGLLAVLLLAVAVIAPVAEELFFRGLLYGWLRSRLTVLPATVIAALLFAGAHGQVSLLLPLALLGAGLCLLYERWRSLWVSAAAHAAINLSALLLALLVR